MESNQKWEDLKTSANIVCWERQDHFCKGNLCLANDRGFQGAKAHMDKRKPVNVMDLGFQKAFHGIAHQTKETLNN